MNDKNLETNETFVRENGETPLTEAQREAIAACSFRTRNVTHTMAYLTTNDEAVKDALLANNGPFSATHYRRDSVTNTYEWEVNSGHSAVIALCGSYTDDGSAVVSEVGVQP